MTPNVSVNVNASNLIAMCHQFQNQIKMSHLHFQFCGVLTPVTGETAFLGQEFPPNCVWIEYTFQSIPPKIQ